MRNKYSVRDYISQELDDISNDSYASDSSYNSDYNYSVPKSNSIKQYRNQPKNITNNVKSKPSKPIINDKSKKNNHVSDSTITKKSITNSVQSFKTLNVIVGGPVDSGKSTLIAYILNRDNNKIKSKRLADILDTSNEERERGITIDVKLNYTKYELSGKSYELVLLDTPGHCDLFTSLIKSSLIAHQSILILDITKIKKDSSYASNVIPLGINHMIIYSHCVGKDIIICINKMDLVDYSESDFISAKSTVTNVWKTLLKIEVNLTFIPIVANTGLNVDKSGVGEVCSWYKGNTLFQELSDRFTSVSIYSTDDLICHVIDQWMGNKELCLKLYLESGLLGKNTKATALPSMIDIIVSSPQCTAKSITDVTIKSKDLDLLGDVVSIVRGVDVPRIAKSIDVKLCTNGMSHIQLTVGQTVELIIGNISEEAYIDSVKDLDNKTSYVIRPGYDYLVSFHLDNETIVHPNASGIWSLSKVIVRFSGTLVGWGTIIHSN